MINFIPANWDLQTGWKYPKMLDFLPPNIALALTLHSSVSFSSSQSQDFLRIPIYKIAKDKNNIFCWNISKFIPVTKTEKFFLISNFHSFVYRKIRFCIVVFHVYTVVRCVSRAKILYLNFRIYIKFAFLPQQKVNILNINLSGKTKSKKYSFVKSVDIKRLTDLLQLVLQIFRRLERYIIIHIHACHYC